MSKVNNIDPLSTKILRLLDDIQRPASQHDISMHNRADEIRRELLGRDARRSEGSIITGMISDGTIRKD